MVNVVERAPRTESAAQATPRARDRAGRAEVRGGWAGDLAVCDGVAWVAWAGCQTREAEFVTEGDREWTLLPGATLDGWRAALRETTFTISLARLDGTTPTGARELARSRRAFEGPTLAALPGISEPAAVWVERCGPHEGSALRASAGTATETVHTSRGAMLGPRAAVDSAGRLWVAWQQWPDRAPAAGAAPRVAVAVRERAGAWSAPLALSEEGRSAWSPALAVGPDGTLWCAWDSWDGASERVVIAHRPPQGAWGEPVPVSTPDRHWLDLAPDVATDGEGAWVVWNRSAPWGIVNHRFNHVRSLHAARVTPGRGGALHVQPGPGAYVGEAGRLPAPSLPFLHSHEHEFVNPQAPRVRLGASGPVVFYRSFRSAAFKDFGWDVRALALTGDRWSGPQRLSTGTGFPDTPYGVALAPGAGDDTWLLAYHNGDYPRPADPAAHPSKPVAGHRLAVERVTLKPLAATADDTSGSEVAIPRRLAPAPARSIASVERRNASSGGTTYEVLWGDLHRHSHLSKCMSANDGDPLDHWRWMTDVGKLDFYGVTEHLEYVSDLEWHRVTDLAQQLAAGGVLALCGFEFSNYPGHTNFFFLDEDVAPDLRAACLTTATGSLGDLWPKLDALALEGRVLAVRHNQSSRGGGLGRGWHDAEQLEATYAPRYERIVEGIQSRGEYKEWLRSLWRRGFRVGVAGATDHSRAAPFPQAITGLWLPPGEHTREGVMRGLHARRTFATNGVRLSVYLSASADADGALPIGMGEQGTIAGPVRLHVQVDGTRDLDTVEVYRDDQLIHIECPGKPEAVVEVVDRDAAQAAAASGGERSYWVRATQLAETNGTRPHKGIVYSSPVWVAAR